MAFRPIDGLKDQVFRNNLSKYRLKTEKPSFLITEIGRFIAFKKSLV
jgi:hypothetical protein